MNRRERRQQQREGVSRSTSDTLELADVAADRGMEAMGGWLALQGHRVKHVVIFLQIDRAPLGQSDSITAVQGYEDPQVALRDMLAHIGAFAEGQGLSLAAALDEPQKAL